METKVGPLEEQKSYKSAGERVTDLPNIHLHRQNPMQKLPSCSTEWISFHQVIYLRSKPSYV